MIVSLTKIYCPSGETVGVLFFLRSNGQLILVSDTIMAVFLFIIMLRDVLIDGGFSFVKMLPFVVFANNKQ
jgi:hypothetical protein